MKHIDSWLAFAGKLGVVIDQMEEIILVTGCHRAKSWANVAFLENQVDAQVTFGMKVEGPDNNIEFQISRGNVHGAVLRLGPEGTVRLYPLDTIDDFGITTRLCTLEPARESMYIYPRISCCSFAKAS